MNLTHFYPKSVENLGTNDSSVNIRFVAKTSDIRNISQNIRSGNTSPCTNAVRILRYLYIRLHARFFTRLVTACSKEVAGYCFDQWASNNISTEISPGAPWICPFLFSVSLETQVAKTWSFQRALALMCSTPSCASSKTKKLNSKCRFYKCRELQQTAVTRKTFGACSQLDRAKIFPAWIVSVREELRHCWSLN